MLDNLDFTVVLEDEFYSVVDRNDFSENDVQSIYNYLNNKTEFISFSDHLKRFILRKLNITSGINEFDIAFYQKYIIDSFNSNQTPKSFRNTTTKTSVITKNWLTQSSVKRDVIFLLGFGLDMSVEEVSLFLINVQKEHDFNFKNPFETVCWYCYKNRLGYPEFVRLMDEYSNNFANRQTINFDSTTEIRNVVFDIKDENDLMECLLGIEYDAKVRNLSGTSQASFERLYNKVRSIIAEQYNSDEEAMASQKASSYMERLENSDKLSIEEKVFRANIIKKSAKKYNFYDISESDVEKVLCCGIPFDDNGNLMKYSYSTLSRHFENKRMSRKHIRDILIGKTDVERFDLITLNFYIHAMNGEENKNKRYIDFLNDTNEILRECFMGEIYVANIYECFLMMCILSDYPMGTYSDVLEMSFENDPESND